MLAILYDIHGNRPALEAVMDDARRRGADRWLLGGDYAAFGAWPIECFELLRDGLGDAATWIRGNWERWQAEPGAVPDAEVVQTAAAWVRGALGSEVVARLGALPASAVIDGTLFVHASPGSDIEPIPETAGEDDDQLLSGVAERRVVFGHTHVQFARRSASGVDLVNSGSVGLPWDGDRRAAYATVGEDGGVALHRVDYDWKAAGHAIEALGEPWSATTAERLREARFDV